MFNFGNLYFDYIPKVVVEIGAGSSFASRTYLLWTIKECEFYLFEPNIFNYEDLSYRSVDFKNVKVFNFAIFDKNGFVEFILAGNNSYISGTYSPLEAYYQVTYELLNKEYKLWVKCIRSDNLPVTKKIDIMFLDMQGIEPIFFEYTNIFPDVFIFRNHFANDSGYIPSRWNIVDRFMKSNNYEIKKISPFDFIFIKTNLIGNKIFVK